jgi:hypothetical protein
MDRIDAVSSSARSRVGNPISFALQDETGLYTKTNKMIDVAEAQRRGAAGMGGRTMETTNCWNPAQHSYAQRTYESTADLTCSSSTGNRRRTCRTGTSVTGTRSTSTCTSGFTVGRFGLDRG